MGDKNFGMPFASGKAYARNEMPNLKMADKDIKLNMARLQGMGNGMAADRSMPHMSERIPLKTSWDDVVLEVSRDRLVDLEKGVLKQPRHSQLLVHSFDPGSLGSGGVSGASSAEIKARLASGVAAAKEKPPASCCPCLPCLGEPEDDHASEATAAASEQASSDCLPCLPCNLL